MGAFKWRKVMGIIPGNLHLYTPKKLNSIVNFLTSTEKWDLDNTSLMNIKHLFTVFQTLLKIKYLQAKGKETEDLTHHHKLVARAEEAVKECHNLDRENEHLKHDVDHLHTQLERLTLVTNDSIGKLNEDLKQAEDDNLHLKKQNKQLQKNMKIFRKEMKEMIDENNKTLVQTGYNKEELKEERDRAKQQVRDFSVRIHTMTEQNESLKKAVKVTKEELKEVLCRRDKDVHGYQSEIQHLKEKLNSAHLDSDKDLITTLQRASKEKDKKIKQLCASVEKQTQLIEGLATNIARNIRLDGIRRRNKSTDEATDRNTLRELELDKSQFQDKLDALLALQKLTTLEDKKHLALDPRAVELERQLDQYKKQEVELQCQLDQQKKREVELARQLDHYKNHQNEILRVLKDDDGTGSIPDPSLPLAHQLEFALSKIREHIRTILDTKATCRSLDEKLKEKAAAQWKVEQDIMSRDRVVDEMRGQLQATATREQHLLADLSKHEEDQSDYESDLRLAHQNIKDLQGRLDRKEDVLKKYQNQLTQATQDQDNLIKRHQEERRLLHQQLIQQTDTSLEQFKQTAMELMNKPNIQVPSTKHLERLAELEETVAEQEITLGSVKHKLNLTTAELQRDRTSMETQAKKHIDEISKLKECHAAQVKALTGETEEQRSQMVRMEKEINDLRTTSTEVCYPYFSNNHVERLRAQLTQKEKQLKKVNQTLQNKMTSDAEKQVIAAAKQREESLKVKMTIDRHTKELREKVEELKKELQTAKNSTKAARGQGKTLQEEVECLSEEIGINKKSQKRMLAENEHKKIGINELKQKSKRYPLHISIKPLKTCRRCATW